jgi:hypothetical protein
MWIRRRFELLVPPGESPTGVRVDGGTRPIGGSRHRQPNLFRTVLAGLLLASVFAGSTADADDALEPYRDRFRQGMEKYKAGALAEAIRAWSAIYEEIGPQRGYRLSFNLARAYEANFETSRAAERYQSFLDEVTARKAANEAMDPIVEREEIEAQKRLVELNATNGRIRILPGSLSVLARIDSADPRLGTFVSYVAPGNHVVVFAPGSTDEERHDVTVQAGEVVDVAPTVHSEPAVPSPAPPPVARTGVDKARRLEMEHPFSPVVLYVAIGVSAASIVVPVLTYGHAYSLIDTHNAMSTSLSERMTIELEYPAARTAAYATLSLPIVLGAATAGLVAFYFGKSKEREVEVSATPLPGGFMTGLSGEF